jgi:hypothetical protein
VASPNPIGLSDGLFGWLLQNSSSSSPQNPIGLSDGSFGFAGFRQANVPTNIQILCLECHKDKTARSR